MARAGLAYLERFYAAASYVGFDGSLDSSSRGVSAKFSNEVALLLYALYQQVTKGGLGSPVDMAKWYMQARPPWTSPSKDYVEFRTPSAMGREILKEETPSIAGNVLSSSKVLPFHSISYFYWLLIFLFLLYVDDVSRQS
ncbi:Acyl-CoA-binding domain-containing protein 4 [Camellia lanceoleosa]|uniref:Acyl-CoA-binding domain-containing protein 4 n=1 Tax=Camellia lanceoleosa TaxID=1840588 RepID=A0ACC0J1X4_9ERIC|nr:Acyl-CoA-binding domain-containing protein 4 [Camellia lanceoleosa]